MSTSAAGRGPNSVASRSSSVTGASPGPAFSYSASSRIRARMSGHRSWTRRLSSAHSGCRVVIGALSDWQNGVSMPSFGELKWPVGRGRIEAARDRRDQHDAGAAREEGPHAQSASRQLDPDPRHQQTDRTRRDHRIDSRALVISSAVCCRDTSSSRRPDRRCRRRRWCACWSTSELTRW